MKQSASRGWIRRFCIRALRVDADFAEAGRPRDPPERQNRIYFRSAARGTSAGAAAALVLRPATTGFPYYPTALCASGWVSLQSRCCSPRWAEADPRPEGRQMSRTGARGAERWTASSPTGTQFLQAVECAEAGRYLDPRSDSITLVNSGEGATSEGEFWEAINAASLLRLPVLFLIEDNGFAISVPVETQTAGGNIANLVRSFPALHVIDADGTDFIAVYAALRDAAAWCRAGNGRRCACWSDAAVIRTRLRRRSLYIGSRARGRAARRPVTRFLSFSSTRELEPQGLRAMAREVDEEIERATARHCARGRPRRNSLREPVLARHRYYIQRFFHASRIRGTTVHMIDEINARWRGIAPRLPDTRLRRGCGRLQPRGDSRK